MPRPSHARRDFPSDRKTLRGVGAKLAIASLLALVGASAAAQPSKQSVLMQIRSNGVASKTKCSVDPFIAAPTPAQPETGATLCAIGGPFGAGMVGIGAPTMPQFAGATIHLDRTFTFGTGQDALTLRTVFNFADQIRAGTGGVNYFNGSWEITGGSGAFQGLRGQGTLVNAIGSTANVPPPPQFAREDLVGWVTR